jgi:1,4-alpha-glucan branching enzyme
MAKSTSIKTKPAITAKPAIAIPVTSGRIALEFVKPEAKKVFVAGSFNQWKPEATPLTSKGNGKWVGDVEVKPGRHEYLFVVDGQWIPDPKAPESVQNPFGGRNSVFVVSE